MEDFELREAIAGADDQAVTQLFVEYLTWAHPKLGASGLRVALGEIGATHDAAAGQVALAWVHHRQQVHGVPVVPIPGTTSVSHLRFNVAAADLTLSDD